MWALQDRGSIQHSIDTLLATAVEHSMPREPAEPRLEPRLHASARHAQHVVLSDSNPFDDRSRWTCFDLSLPLNGKGKLGLVLRRATARRYGPAFVARACGTHQHAASTRALQPMRLQRPTDHRQPRIQRYSVSGLLDDQWFSRRCCARSTMPCNNCAA